MHKNRELTGTRSFFS